QPDGANLLPAGRDAVDDPPRDDEMAARVVVAERETESMVVESGGRAARRREYRAQRGETAAARQYNHVFILWGDSSAGSKRSRSPSAHPGCSSSRSSIRRCCRCPKSPTCSSSGW